MVVNVGIGGRASRQAIRPLYRLQRQRVNRSAGCASTRHTYLVAMWPVS